MPRWKIDRVDPFVVELDLWYSCFNLREKWIVDNYAYREKDIDFEVRFRDHHEELRHVFIELQNIEAFVLTPVPSEEEFVSASAW